MISIMEYISESWSRETSHERRSGRLSVNMHVLVIEGSTQIISRFQIDKPAQIHWWCGLQTGGCQEISICSSSCSSQGLPRSPLGRCFLAYTGPFCGAERLGRVRPRRSPCRRSSIVSSPAPSLRICASDASRVRERGFRRLHARAQAYHEAEEQLKTLSRFRVYVLQERSNTEAGLWDGKKFYNIHHELS